MATETDGDELLEAFTEDVMTLDGGECVHVEGRSPYVVWPMAGVNAWGVLTTTKCGTWQPKPRPYAAPGDVADAIGAARLRESTVTVDDLETVIPADRHNYEYEHE